MVTNGCTTCRQVSKPISFYTGTVFAYGQTSSGKTHTMFGNEADYGIIPLSIEQIFSVAFDVSTVDLQRLATTSGDHS